MSIELEQDAPLIEYKTDDVDEHYDQLLKSGKSRAKEDSSESDSGDSREVLGDDEEDEQDVVAKKSLEEEMAQMDDKEKDENHEMSKEFGVEDNDIGDDIEAQKNDNTEKVEAKKKKDIRNKIAVDVKQVDEKTGVEKSDGNGEKVGLDKTGISEQDGLEKKMAYANTNPQGHDDTKTGPSQDKSGDSMTEPNHLNPGKGNATTRLVARLQAAWESCYITFQQSHFAAAARQKVNEYKEHPIVNYSREYSSSLLFFLVGVFAGIMFSSILLGFYYQHSTTPASFSACLPAPRPVHATYPAHVELYPTHLPVCSSDSSFAAAVSTACRDSLSPASILDLQKRFNRTQTVGASEFIKREIEEALGDVVQARVLEVLAKQNKLAVERDDEQRDWVCVDVLIGSLAVAG